MFERKIAIKQIKELNYLNKALTKLKQNVSRNSKLSKSII